MGVPHSQQRKYTIILNKTQLKIQITKPYKTIINVPAVINMQPINDFAVNSSCKNTKAKTNVITTLNLSIGTTFDASPTCKALY